MRKTYSRLQKIEDKQNKKKALILIGISVFLILLFAIFGLPLVARVAEVVIGINKSGSLPNIEDTTNPTPPKIGFLPEQTNTPNLEITGSSEPGTLVKIYFNETHKELLAGASGNFSTDFALQDGENKIYATAEDNAGNISEQSDTLKVILDKEPPSLEITEPREGMTLYGNKQRQVAIKGVTESNARVTINDRVVVVENSGNFTFVTSLAEGENQFTIRSSDPAGNITESVLNLVFYL
ncbi:MAG: Biofilm associated protein A [uncultured bacterium]|nr:MAG: Biofilm associated protein A [uncultured bacterium]